MTSLWLFPRAIIMKKEIMAVLILILSSCLFWVSIGYAQDSRFMSDRPWQEERGVPSIMRPEKAESAGSLNDNANTNIRIKITPDQAVFRSGEPMTFTVVADQDCYLTLMYLSPSGKVTIIWPYGSDSFERNVRHNETVRVPDIGGRFKLVSDGSAPYERIVAVACAERNLLLQKEDFLVLPETPVISLRGPIADFAARVIERTKRVPGQVRWGTAEQNIRVSSSQPQTTSAGARPESQSQQHESVNQGTSEQDTAGKLQKTMWIGGYYVTKHRRCGNKDLKFTGAEIEGFLKSKPAWLKTNFFLGNEDVRASDFQTRSCYYSSPSRPNGFDGIDSVHIAAADSHGGLSKGVYHFCLGGPDGCSVASNKMSLGKKNLRYLFLQTCHSAELPRPDRVWRPSAKGIRAIFGYSGETVDDPNYGRYFFENWKKSHKITRAFLDASWRISHKNVPVALWFGPDKRTVEAMCKNEADFHFEPVQPRHVKWQSYFKKPIRRAKDIDLVPGASVVFKPVEEDSALPSVVERLGLVKKGSFQLIDKGSTEDTTAYSSHDNGPTLLVNRSSGAFDLMLPEFESKGSVEYGDEEAISVASAYCEKLETQLKSLSLKSENVSAELKPCEIRHTIEGSSSDTAREPNEQITQTCVVFRPVMNGLPTIGTGGVLEITLNSAKEVCRVRSVLREVASVTQRKSILDPHSLEPLAKQRALRDVRQMTGDENCRVKSVELGYFAADESEIQKVSSPSFQVVVESGKEPSLRLYEQVYDMQDLERERHN
jgi:hypothetical protein